MANLRVSGFTSGIDVDSVVKQMMTAKRVPLDKLTQQKQTMEWQRENYREINSKLVDFKSNKLTVYDKSSALNTQAAVISGETTALKAVATAEANGVSMNIKVTQVAEPLSATTAGAIMSQSGGTRLTSSSTLADLQKLNTNTAAASNYTVTINNVAISLSSDLSISAAITKINSTTGTNVNAKFDEVTGKLSFSSTTYSNDTKMSFGSGDTFQKLFGGVSSTSPYKPAIIEVIDEKNTPTQLSFASNNFKLNGIQLTLLAKSTSSSIVTTTTDPTTALDTIKSFVADYNNLLSTLNTKVNEERYNDFAPLTDEQREAMSDTQIETWEKKAKSGLLKNDEILKSTLTAMRSVITEKLGQLSNYGITTGQYYENGKLYIDEEKLKQSISNNPQGIVEIFQGGSGSSTKSLFEKLSTTMTTAVEKLSTKAGTSKYSADLTATFKYDSVMGKSLADYTTRISSLQNKLDDYEDNLYKRFTAMETAMSKYNSQSSSLASYMTS